MLLSVDALIDSGAAVNVLPQAVGFALGAVRSGRLQTIPLSGALASVRWQPLTVAVTIGPFAPVSLLFAWTDADITPVIFGQTNFFQLFDVCFFGSRGEFEIAPAPPAGSGSP